MWKEFLCSAEDEFIILWKDYNSKALTLQGHTNGVTCLAPAGEYLFSGSHDNTIRKWNEHGQCLAIIERHTDTVTSLLMYNGELFSGSWDETMKRWNLGTTSSRI